MKRFGWWVEWAFARRGALRARTVFSSPNLIGSRSSASSGKLGTGAMPAGDKTEALRSSPSPASGQIVRLRIGEALRTKPGLARGQIEAKRFPLWGADPGGGKRFTLRADNARSAVKPKRFVLLARKETSPFSKVSRGKRFGLVESSAGPGFDFSSVEERSAPGRLGRN